MIRSKQRSAVGAVILAVAAAGAVAAATTAGAATALPAGCAGASPITCHVDVAPGNYTLKVTLGGAAAADTSVFVEARRELLATVHTAANARATYTFTVNVRTPEGQPTGQGGTGTAGLSISFGGAAPAVSALSVTSAAKPLVVYLAGDSTVCDQPAAPYTGWGQILPASVKAGAVIANYADSGESSGSFLANAALFPTLEKKITTGDLVLIQFGHNDKTTTAAAYRNNLTAMVKRVRAKGGIPVLVTPPVRHLFSGGKLTATALHVNGVGVNLPAEMRSVASAQNVQVLDLTARSKALVEPLGDAASARIYLTKSADGVTDNTHFSFYGAGQLAALVIAGVKSLNLPLASYLR